MSFIAYMTHSGYITQDAIFAREMRRRAGLSATAFVHGQRDARWAEREGAFERVVDLVSGFKPEHAKAQFDRNVARLVELEKADVGATLLQDIFQDRWLLGRFDLPYIAAYLAHAADVLSDALSGPVVAVIGEMTMAVYRLARRLTVGRAPYLFPIGARFFPRFYFEDSLFMEWTRCRETYRRFQRDGLPPEVLAPVEAVYQDITQHQAVPAMFAHLKANPGMGAEPIKSKLKLDRLAENVAYWRFEAAEAVHNPRVLTTMAEMLPQAKIWRWQRERQVIRWFRQQALVQPDDQTNYATCFLHYQPEYTVEGIGFPFANQVTLIRTIAQSLPIGMQLIVKEQPFMLGLRPRAYYEELLALPNVKLASESANSRAFIQHSQIVFTISGTSALEAMFFGVPAVVFSPVCHSEFEGITRVRDLYGLPDVVRNLLRQGRVDGATRGRVALAAMYAESYPGELATLAVPAAHTSRPENQTRLGAALEAELKRRGLLG